MPLMFHGTGLPRRGGRRMTGEPTPRSRSPTPSDHGDGRPPGLSLV